MPNFLAILSIFFKYMYKFSLFLGLFLSLFIHSCAPAIWQLTDATTNPQALNNAFGKQNTNTENNAAPSNVWVDMQRHYVYAGIPNRIRILNGGEPSLSVGTIKETDNIGEYFIEVDMPGIVTELSSNIISKSNETKVEKIMYTVLPLPMPEWRIAGLQNGKMLAKDFRSLRNFELISTAVGEKTAVINCTCLGFKVLKIDSKNQRSETNNPNAEFSPEVINLLNTATTGDIFIIQQLKTQCSPKDRTRIMQSLAIEII